MHGKFLAVVAALAIFSTPAQANIIDVTFAGTVNQGLLDVISSPPLPTLVNLHGVSFAADFVFDTNLGTVSGNTLVGGLLSSSITLDGVGTGSPCPTTLCLVPVNGSFAGPIANGLLSFDIGAIAASANMVAFSSPTCFSMSCSLVAAGVFRLDHVLVLNRAVLQRSPLRPCRLWPFLVLSSVPGCWVF
jgi:hypothetical protein